MHFFMTDCQILHWNTQLQLRKGNSSAVHKFSFNFLVWLSCLAVLCICGLVWGCAKLEYRRCDRDRVNPASGFSAAPALVNRVGALQDSLFFPVEPAAKQGPSRQKEEIQVPTAALHSVGISSLYKSAPRLKEVRYIKLEMSVYFIRWYLSEFKRIVHLCK